ncbi:MAG: hypothetical protein E3J86_09050 [Candidatus Thorarchaeota archaeon]|nr:MAG: hypothetical protein E3J86_09050 [Candidatus Thorarchaeota archaeon]
MVEAILWFTDMNPGQGKGLAFKTVNPLWLTPWNGSLESLLFARGIEKDPGSSPGGGATLIFY